MITSATTRSSASAARPSQSPYRSDGAGTHDGDRGDGGVGVDDGGEHVHGEEHDGEQRDAAVQAERDEARHAPGRQRPTVATPSALTIVSSSSDTTPLARIRYQTGMLVHAAASAGQPPVVTVVPSGRTSRAGQPGALEPRRSRASPRTIASRARGVGLDAACARPR